MLAHEAKVIKMFDRDESQRSLDGNLIHEDWVEDCHIGWQFLLVELIFLNDLLTRCAHLFRRHCDTVLRQLKSSGSRILIPHPKHFMREFLESVT